MTGVNPGWNAASDRLEPAAVEVYGETQRNGAAYSIDAVTHLSIAISLKRIADYLEPIEVHHAAPEVLGKIGGSRP